MTVVYKKGSVG